jgi:type III secretion system FlhB-like substrate exporter
MPAPIVVAKGLDLLAAKIKEIARDRDIPLMENRALAQALYKAVDVGDEIPGALYQAVAEILVLVFKAQEEVKRREAQRRAASNPFGGETAGEQKNLDYWPRSAPLPTGLSQPVRWRSFL